MKAISNPIKRVAVAGAAVIVLGGAAVGIAAAQAQPSTTSQTPYQKFIAALATRLNVPQAILEQDISAARQDAGLPAGNAFPRGHGGGPHGFGEGFDLPAAAQAIGITPEQLRTEWQKDTLATVARNHQKDPTDVASALKTAAHDRIQQIATDRNLTPDQVTSADTRADQRIDQLMSETLPRRGPGMGGPRGFGPGRGMIQQGLNVAAQAIGITPRQLQTELQSSKTLTDVAKEHQKDPAVVANALKTEAHARIQQMASARGLAQDQINQDITRADQMIDQLMTRTLPPRPNRPGGDDEDPNA